MRKLLACAFVLVSVPVWGQTGQPIRTLPVPLAPGTMLPIYLLETLIAGRTRPGTPIHGRLTQRVPVSPQQYLKRGTELRGIVLESVAASASQPARLTLRLDQVLLAGQTLPMATGAVAIANFVAVSDTADPCAGATDRANPDPANWTTCQVGGQQVVRSGWSGPLLDQTGHAVGFADFDGVYGNPSAPDTLPLALGVFSSDAHGLFGYDPLARLASGRSSFTVTAPGRLVLNQEDNLLLKVDSVSTLP